MTAAAARFAPLPRLAGSLGGFALLAALFVAWEAFTRLANVPTYLLPSPSRILEAAISEAPDIAEEAGRTLSAALAGLFLGSSVALATAIAVQRSRTFELTVLPFTLVLQSVPVVALTPVLAVIIGRNYLTAVVVAAMICYFPVLVNTVRGLRSATREHVHLFHVLAAGAGQELRILRLPASLPYAFGGLRVAASLCIPGTIIAEWVTSASGLGPYIINQAVLQRSENVWAGIAVSTLLTLVIYGTVVAADRFALRWSGFPDR